MSIQEDIRQAASGLPRGQTVRVVCPHCDAKHEKSFAITRDFERPWRLLFMCHRGTCSSRAGFVEDRDGATLVLSKWDEAPPEDLALSSHQHAPDAFLDDIKGLYGIGTGYLRRQGVMYEKESAALCMPWLSPEGVQVGWVEKRLHVGYHKSHHELASRSYSSRLSFPRINISYHSAHRVNGTCVLVEGLLDAYRIGELAERGALPIFPVALLGAQISNVDVHNVASMFGRVVVLLDPDQWPKGAIRVAKRFRTYSVDIKLMTMETDPKDASEDELLALFGTIAEAFPWNT